MLKILLFLCNFCILSYAYLPAVDISQNKSSIYKYAEISRGLSNIDNAIKSNDFAIVSKLPFYLKRAWNKKNLWVRFRVTNGSNKFIQRSILLRWKNINLDMYVVKEQSIEKYEIARASKKFNFHETINLLPKENADIYLHVKSQKYVDQFYYMYILNPDILLEVVAQNESFFGDGFFFGILLTMLLYNVFMYLSTREKSSLYYCLFQGSALFFISNSKFIDYEVSEGFLFILFFLIKVLVPGIIFVFATLFTKEFLHTATKFPLMNRVLNILMIAILLNTLINGFLSVSFSKDLILVNYATAFAFVFIFCGIYSIYKGNKSAIYYTIGFSFFSLSWIINNVIKVHALDIDIDFHRFIQGANALEAFFLSLAVYSKIKAVVKEHEIAVENVNKQEKMLLVQSRFAALGEMIANIAHQWRQPLNHITIVLANLQLKYETKTMTDIYFNKKVDELNRQLKYMSTTIDDFRNFFSPRKEKETFNLKELVKYTLEIGKSSLKKKNINVSINEHFETVLTTYKNELAQVLLILLSNSCDAYSNTEDGNRHIIIDIKEDILSVSDNAGGIDEKIISKIFDPYFTTKDKKIGTGLGLYTAKIIVQNNINGHLYVKNTTKGAKFIIKFSI